MHSIGEHSVSGSRNTKLRVLKLDKINIFKMANKKIFYKDKLNYLCMQPHVLTLK